LDDIHQISNLTPEHQHILSFLGSSCQNIIYFAEPTCGLWVKWMGFRPLKSLINILLSLEVKTDEQKKR
jgi:hypothetical protein